MHDTLGHAGPGPTRKPFSLSRQRLLSIPKVSRGISCFRALSLTNLPWCLFRDTNSNTYSSLSLIRAGVLTIDVHGNSTAQVLRCFRNGSFPSLFSLRARGDRPLRRNDELSKLTHIASVLMDGWLYG